MQYKATNSLKLLGMRNRSFFISAWEICNRRPPSLSELTPYRILYELTHLGSDVSNCQFNLSTSDDDALIISFTFSTLLFLCIIFNLHDHLDNRQDCNEKWRNLGERGILWFGSIYLSIYFLSVCFIPIQKFFLING